MRRKKELVTGEVYHILNKSIADFKIFNSNFDFLRMKYMLKYYSVKDVPLRFYQFIELEKSKKDKFNKNFIISNNNKQVQIIAYCIMPTHLHLILKQLKERGISIYVGNILNSYSRYFNNKHDRKGPLWEGKFKNVLVETEEQLLHLTRYIHLNPVTAHLVDNPQDWPASSYKEYISKVNNIDAICEYNNVLDIEPSSYKKFVEDRISYQRELAKLKELSLE